MVRMRHLAEKIANNVCFARVELCKCRSVRSMCNILEVRKNTTRQLMQHG